MAIAAQEMESHPINERMRPNTPPAPSYSPLPRRNGLPKKTVRFEIPPERSLLNIDQLIAQSTNEEEIKELKQQKRLLLNKQAALEARNRKESQDHQNDELTKEQTSRMSDADSMRIKNQFRKLAKEIEEEEFKT
ncbi:Basic-leucine zipper (bZIP) transcription factor [Lasiodiplodia theobromae]|uniref:Uncharacterized protein n=1 Tax=Lasiodiplodia theobromae TaxID=45133 RepID=A0A5N5D1C6_9PEZI|nr:hypothetical protein DBV05_g9876 [Lasiodiplodia theobromae]KAF9634827.1 Basic-leucine zipper (bZIP) transcription factor [Lasiodiplodia theobromae]